MTPKRDRHPKEVTPFAALVMMTDFIDEEMPRLKPAEVKLALTIWRKTAGWAKFSDAIGVKQLSKCAGLDRDTVKRTTPQLCERLGIKMEQKRNEGVLLRRQFTWPLNERVKALLEKAAQSWDVGGKLPPRVGGLIDPQGGGVNPPTQYNPYQSQSRNKVMRSMAVEMKPVNFGDLLFYSEKVQQRYNKLIEHDHREREGARRGDPLPFSSSEFVTLVREALKRGVCHHCAGELNESNFSPDHMTALSIGGTSELSNIRIICWECNKQKGHMLDERFHAKLARTRIRNHARSDSGPSDVCFEV